MAHLMRDRLKTDRRVVCYWGLSANQDTESQITMIRDYCKKNNLTIVRLEGEGIPNSSRIKDRPVLKSLLECIDRGEANGLVVARMNNVSSSLGVAIDFIRRLYFNKHDFHAAKELFHTTSDMHVALLSAMKVVISFEFTLNTEHEEDTNDKEEEVDTHDEEEVDTPDDEERVDVGVSSV